MRGKTLLALVSVCAMLVAGARPAAGYQAGQVAAGRVVGRVVDAATRWPVAGAEVRVAGTALSAVTDSAGGFRIAAVPVGVVSLEVSSLGFRPAVRTDVVVSTGKPTTVTVEVTASPIAVMGIVVRPAYFVPSVDAPTSTQRMRAEEIRRSPGSQEDVVRAVSVLPGVAPTAAHDNMLVVRGGAPFENLFVVDGLEVPDINHFAMQGGSGGQTTLINLDLVERVDFSAGGFGATDGDRVGSVTTIELRDGLRERHAGEVNFAITGVGAIAEGPLGRGSYLVSLRRSYLDLILDAAGESFFLRYWDVNAKVEQPLGRRDRLSWTFVGAVDRFGFNVDTPEDAYDAALMATNDDQYFTSVTWSHLGERSRLEVTAGRISHAYDTYQNDTLATTIFSNRSTEVETSLRIAYVRTLRDGSALELGGVAKYHTPLRYEVMLPGFSRPDAEGTPRRLDVDTTLTALRAGAFGEARIQWTPRLATTLGMRMDHYGHLGDAVRIAPRLAATLDIGGGTTLNVSGGRYWQTPSFIWLVGDPGNAERLKPLRVDQGVVGVQKLVGANVKLQVDAYYKRYGDYPTRLWHPQAVVAPGNFESVDADVPFGLEPLTSEATGRAYGAELFVQKRLGEVPVYGSAGFSLSRSEFTALDGRTRVGSYDTPVLASILLGWRPAPLWDLGMRFRAGSGRPKTPFIASGPLEGRLDFERYNDGGRMPSFHALDIRIDRRWAFRRFQLTTYLDIQDLYNRNNPIGYLWDDRLRAPRYENAIGFLPSFGINVEF